MHKAFFCRLYPQKAQISKLSNILNTSRHLYNASIEERRDAWQKQHKSLNFYDQTKELKELRKAIPEVAQLNFSATQDLLKRVDKTFKDFFRRIRNGNKAGYPRFKGKNQFNSITFPAYGDGIKLKEGKLYIQHVGLVKIKMHRFLEGGINTVTIKCINDKWYAIFSNTVEIEPLPHSNKEVGIDVGIESFAVTSDNEFIQNPKFLRKSESKLRKAQRKVSRRKKGSGNRRKAVKLLAKQYLKISNQRKDFANKESRKIIDKYGYIAVEDLNIENMVKNHHLAKSINDASWGQFINMLSYKAEWAGRQFVKVNAWGTSQTCSGCGFKVPKTLSVRIHNCPNFGT